VASMYGALPRVGIMVLARWIHCTRLGLVAKRRWRRGECGILKPKRSHFALAEDFQVPAGEAVGDELVETVFAVVLSDDESDPVEGRSFAEDRKLALFTVEFEDVDVVEAVFLHQVFERERTKRAKVGPEFVDANGIGFVGCEFCIGR